jgi:Mrp family chromosome partitioning ATPase/capsular polysaccharide biosynthesis protein
MDARRLLDLLRRRLVVIAASGAVGALAGLATTPAPVTSYSAVAVIGVSPAPASRDPSGIQTLDTMDSYATLARSPAVAAAAAARSGTGVDAGQLIAETQVQLVPGTYFMVLAVRDPRPAAAAALANALAGAVIDYARSHPIRDSTGQVLALPDRVVQSAVVPTVGSTTADRRRWVDGLVLGLVGSALVLWLLDVASDPVWGDEQVERSTGRPVAAILPRASPGPTPRSLRRRLRRLIGEDPPAASPDELERAFDALAAVVRSVLGARPGADPRLVVVCGPDGGEGATFVADGLAQALERSGWTAARRNLDRAAPPAELASRARAGAAGCRAVVVDSPPALSGPETVDLAAGADAVLVVAAWEGTRRARLDRAARLLGRLGGPWVGVVIDSAPAPRPGRRRRPARHLPDRAAPESAGPVPA